MNTPPLVSIALPAFNGEKVLGDAIASILLQTYQNWELLLIDDGSSDRTVAVAREFNDPRIRVFSDGANRGLPARLNEAIDRSSGKYFARMDQDDICFPERLQKQVEYLEAHFDVDLLGTRAMTFVSPWRAVGLFPFRQTHEGICRRPWSGFYLPHPTWMGRLGWFRKHRYAIPEVRRAEDHELLLRTYSTSRFACLPEILFAYRLRDRIAVRLNMTGRTSLLKSQVGHFSARGQWGYSTLAVLCYIAKSAGDAYRLLRGGVPRETGVAGLAPQWNELRRKIARLNDPSSGCGPAR